MSGQDKESDGDDFLDMAEIPNTSSEEISEDEEEVNVSRKSEPVEEEETPDDEPLPPPTIESEIEEEESEEEPEPGLPVEYELGPDVRAKIVG